MLLSERVKNSAPSSTVRIADQAQLLREAGEQVFDFSAGRAFEDTPEYIVNATMEALRLGDTHQTMARGKTIYREAIAAKLKRDNGIIANPENEIIATMGCKQGLTIALLASINAGDEVIIEDPCFVSYRQTIEYLGGKAVPVRLDPENNFRWSATDLELAVTSRTRALIVCSPHNPTGIVHTAEELQVIADFAIRHDLTVITDEVYERVVWAGHQHRNLCKLAGMKQRTITLMSFTKSFAMGGWRVGFIYASAETIIQLEKLQQHLVTSVNSFVQVGAAVACGQPPDEQITGYWREWEKKVHYANEYINAIPGLSCKKAEGGFYAWVKIHAAGVSSVQFSELLLQTEKVAVVDGASFGAGGENYFRFTCVRSWEELNTGLQRLKRFLKNYDK